MPPADYVGYDTIAEFERRTKMLAGGWLGEFRAKLPEMAGFETCNMLCPGLEMYSCALTKDVGRRTMGGCR